MEGIPSTRPAGVATLPLPVSTWRSAASIDSGTPAIQRRRIFMSRLGTSVPRCLQSAMAGREIWSAEVDEFVSWSCSAPVQLPGSAPSPQLGGAREAECLCAGDASAPVCVPARHGCLLLCVCLSIAHGPAGGQTRGATLAAHGSTGSTGYGLAGQDAGRRTSQGSRARRAMPPYQAVPILRAGPWPGPSGATLGIPFRFTSLSKLYSGAALLLLGPTRRHYIADHLHCPA